MVTPQRVSSQELEQLHREWMERSERAFQKMFAADQQKQLVTFTQREDRAVDLGQELAQWLMEEHIASDPAAQPSRQEAEVPRCPRCGKPGRVVTEAKQSLAERSVVSRAGVVGLEREQCFCTTCRVVFFPLGPEAGADRRGI